MGRPKGSKNKPKQQAEQAPKQEQKDLPEEVVGSAALYKDNEQAKLAKEFDYRVSYLKKKKQFIIDVDGQSTYKAFLKCDGKVIKCSDVREAFSDKSAKRDSWRGGSFKEIVDSEAGKFDIAPFAAQREKLKKSIGNLEFLEAELARKRTRFMSEHDGELDFDRLYEREPFSATRIVNNGVARTMDINVDFSFSAGVEAKDIEEYGTMAWSVADILEKSGIRCNVFITTFNAGQSSGELPVETYLTRIKIKSCEEYIDTADIARHFTPNYYRRVVFHAWTLGNEAAGRSMAWGLGRPAQWDRKAQAEKGVLNFSIGQMRDFKLDKEALVKYIREAL